MKFYSPLVRRSLVTLSCALMLGACTTWEEQYSPSPAPTRSLQTVRLTRTDGTSMVLRNAVIRDDSIVGTRPQTTFRTAVTVADVKKTEIQHTDFSATFWTAAIGVAAGFFGFFYLAFANDAS